MLLYTSSALLLYSSFKTHKPFQEGTTVARTNLTPSLRIPTLPPFSCQDPLDIPASPFFLLIIFLLSPWSCRHRAGGGQSFPGGRCRCRSRGCALSSLRPCFPPSRVWARSSRRQPAPLLSSFKSNRFPYIGKHKLRSWWKRLTGSKL